MQLSKGLESLSSLQDILDLPEARTSVIDHGSSTPPALVQADTATSAPAMTPRMVARPPGSPLLAPIPAFRIISAPLVTTSSGDGERFRATPGNLPAGATIISLDLLSPGASPGPRAKGARVGPKTLGLGDGAFSRHRSATLAHAPMSLLPPPLVVRSLLDGEAAGYEGGGAATPVDRQLQGPSPTPSSPSVRPELADTSPREVRVDAGLSGGNRAEGGAAAALVRPAVTATSAVRGGTAIGRRDRCFGSLAAWADAVAGRACGSAVLFTIISLFFLFQTSTVSEVRASSSLAFQVQKLSCFVDAHDDVPLDLGPAHI